MLDIHFEAQDNSRQMRHGRLWRNALSLMFKTDSLVLAALARCAQLLLMRVRALVAHTASGYET